MVCDARNVVNLFPQAANPVIVKNACISRSFQVKNARNVAWRSRKTIGVDIAKNAIRATVKNITGNGQNGRMVIIILHVKKR